MSKQSVRFFLWIVILFFGFLLFNAWEKEKSNFNDFTTNDSKVLFDNKDNLIDHLDVPKYFTKESSFDSNNEVIINTNLFFAKINLHGGDINFLSLKKYPSQLNVIDDGVVVFDISDEKYYIAQSGFLNDFGPDSKSFGRCLYSSVKKNYDMVDGELQLVVVLNYLNEKNVIIEKIYTFKSYSYDINVEYVITNNGNEIYSGRMYGLIKQKNRNSKSSFFSSNVTRSYNGCAIYTKEKPYKKLSFDDISSKSFYDVVNGGWVAMLEHYFLTTWIPAANTNHIYSTEKTGDDFYFIKYLDEDEIFVKPEEVKKVSSILYVGPKIKSMLSKLSKGLDLVIDYGIFWPIASPVFLLLSGIYSFVGNWGVSIILVTLVIKLLFFHLSSISYRSMGNMKKLQPRLEILKNRYKDDKKKFGQAVMELYKKENVNPLGGCLPILVQIPVFISLYYVLLESVELRHAHFIFWINDLSDKDSYYILPIIMSFTMYIQQKLNPPIQDPMQAKIMAFLPVVFLFLFLQFPSGLILYWIVNNILSIFQQWFIMKKISDKSAL
ncbi:MAG TPA: membrane protein insertase YidC [Candidatus Azoamicus sp. OHIO1]